MKSKLFGLGFLVLALMVMPLMTAAVAEIAPVANSNHTGTVVYNCSYVNGTDTTNPVEANSSFFTNQTGAFVRQTVTGFVCTDTYCSASGALTTAMDSAGIEFNCTLGNATNFVGSSGTPLRGITFDSTDPVVSLSVDLSGEVQSYGRGLEYTCTTADGIDSGPTETFAVAHPSGDDPTTTSLTLQSTKLFFDDTDYTGDFVFTCTSTDYTGNIGTDSNTITVDSLGRVKSVSSNSGSSSGSNIWVWIVLGLVVFWLVNNSKKK